MDKQDIMLSDFHRILFGEAPAIFLLEVLIRTIITYAVLLVATRWLGKRMSGHLSITEMAVMLTLGAIVSVAMQVPESGVLMAIIVLVCTLSFERGLSWLEFKSKKTESITQGMLSILVKDGVLDHREMNDTRISNQQLFAALRSKGISNLGQVKRVYLESSGIFSIYKADKEQPGLATFPPDDVDMIHKQESTDVIVCCKCGYVNQTKNDSRICINCQYDQFTNAICSTQA